MWKSDIYKNSKTYHHLVTMATTAKLVAIEMHSSQPGWYVVQGISVYHIIYIYCLSNMSMHWLRIHYIYIY